MTELRNSEADASRFRLRALVIAALVLSGIVRLRSHPVLRGVAQRIPQRWQMQVKSWLRA